MNEKQIEQFGNEVIKLLSLKVKSNGRVNTNIGDKTPLGLGKMLIRYMKEAKEK